MWFRYLPIVTLISFFVIENLWPRRVVKLDFKRIFSNISLAAVFNIFYKLILPFGLMYLCKWVEVNKIGVLMQFGLAAPVRLALALLIFDCAIYFQHRLFHVVDFFWKFHRVHHTDQHLDTSSALRFHPIELAMSIGVKSLVILAFGINVGAYLVFEVVLASMAQFNHANFYLPNWLDKPLRVLFVTPDFHRTHHEQECRLMNANYGFNLSIWDYLFRSYKTVSFEAQKNLSLGVRGFSVEYFWSLLKQPFR